MNPKLLSIGIFYFLIAHICVFIQLNGQFKWDWFRKNELILAISGVFISFLYIWGTKYVVEGMDGLLWPTRFIGFTIGMLVYALGVSIFFKEGFTLKTYVSLGICVLLIYIQVFWKNK